MLDFDASKLLIIGVVALVVIGPKDLPRVLRQVGQMVGKLRRMAGEFQGQFMDAMKEADLQDLRNEVSKLKDTASLDVDFNPVHDIRTELTRAVDAASAPVGQFARATVAGDVGPPSDVGGQLAPSTEPTSPPATGPEDAGLVAAGIAPLAEVVPSAQISAGPAGDAKRRKVIVPKRKAPGNRLGSSDRAALPGGRGRSYLPPRRDPEP